MPGALASAAAAAFSAVLRARYSLRSSSSPAAPFTITITMVGSVAAAMRPTTALFTGTSRHPSTLRPSAAMDFSRISLLCAACAGSCGKNTMPTPEEPSVNPSILLSAANLLSTFQGMLHMMPAPSPESSSALHAPRCSMHPSAMSASVTVLCVRRPLRLAMNPTPHASDSSSSCSLSTTPPVYGARAMASTTVLERAAAAGASERRLRNLGSAEDLPRRPMKEGMDTWESPTARRDAATLARTVCCAAAGAAPRTVARRVTTGRATDARDDILTRPAIAIDWFFLAN
mmetsp:Transcript_27015/g.66242  ORF Transcript_27015/g.66242 Transcript_27015/m.66242 type:complete len:288 (-) Transcript_27015:145-1008(-)